MDQYTYGCFISGTPQQLVRRPVLRDNINPFAQFPNENNWVDQLTGANLQPNGDCVPASIEYQCAVDKTCKYYSYLAGNIAPNGSPAPYDPRILAYPQVNGCTTNVRYRQTLDSRRSNGCGTC